MFNPFFVWLIRMVVCCRVSCWSRVCVLSRGVIHNLMVVTCVCTQNKTRRHKKGLNFYFFFVPPWPVFLLFKLDAVKAFIFSYGVSPSHEQDRTGGVRGSLHQHTEARTHVYCTRITQEQQNILSEALYIKTGIKYILYITIFFL